MVLFDKELEDAEIASRSNAIVDDEVSPFGENLSPSRVVASQ